jgi:hypothetical protein
MLLRQAGGPGRYGFEADGGLDTASGFEDGRIDGRSIVNGLPRGSRRARAPLGQLVCRQVQGVYELPVFRRKPAAVPAEISIAPLLQLGGQSTPCNRGRLVLTGQEPRGLFQEREVMRGVLVNGADALGEGNQRQRGLRRHDDPTSSYPSRRGRKTAGTLDRAFPGR